MAEKSKESLNTSVKGPVFVIGTGRSGTHWLGYALGDHPEVRATIEVHPIFGFSTEMALNSSLEDQMFDRLVEAYQAQLLKSAPKLYVDKSHPNIWLAEKLKQAFPSALFVGIERNPYATVASMMKHPAVSAWHKRWREFPIPNRFLGITQEVAEMYDDLPLASQCAMRWKAHHQRMIELKDILGNDLFVMRYEYFAEHTEDTIQQLKCFLGLHEPIPVPEVKRDSMNKWRSQLSDEEISQIQSIVGFSPDVVNF